MAVSGKRITHFGRKYKRQTGKMVKITLKPLCTSSKSISIPVILSPDFKQEIQSDVSNFFSSEAVYHELAVPWKRGVIFLGPPGEYNSNLHAL
jgi:hypothetical protein